ncbi:MAG: leucine-rich repeat domain-containing protein [Treponema sp.]|jgi:hypothetical protein|nr:leucine-rich repeat domain-containing protein [Treponema sp.]
MKNSDIASGVAAVVIEANLKGRAANTAADPYTVVLPAITIDKNDDADSGWGKVNTAVKNAQRYVILDLSGCTFTGNEVIGCFGHTGISIIKDNKYIKGINLPGSLTSIGNYAFWGCFELTSVTIPASITSIGDGAFHNCITFTSVSIPAGVTSIGKAAFYNCFKLTGVTIPASVASIGDEAFRNCAALTSVTFEGGGMTGAGFNNGAFPGADLYTAYQSGGAGVYTRPAGGSAWTKQ